MNEMIERVARAIYAAQWNDPHCAPPIPFEDAVQDPRHSLVEMAKAAIEAMREPTKAMLEAANTVIVGDFIEHKSDEAYLYYRAIIDAALQAALTPQSQGEK